MICACLVPVRIAVAFGAFGSADVSGEDCGVEACSSFALCRLVRGGPVFSTSFMPRSALALVRYYAASFIFGLRLS